MITFNVETHEVKSDTTRDEYKLIQFKRICAKLSKWLKMRTTKMSSFKWGIMDM